MGTIHCTTERHAQPKAQSAGSKTSSLPKVSTIVIGASVENVIAIFILRQNRNPDRAPYTALARLP
jgi:hypothetical protein